MADFIVSAPTRHSGARRLGFFSRLRHWNAVQRQRRQLAALGEEQLKDIGLTKSDVAAETARPFWDAPGHWYR